LTGDTDPRAARGGDELYLPAARPPTVAVIVPAYNEQDAVRGTIEHVRRALAGAHVPHEIVVVNDGSDDQTSARAREAGVRVIDFPDNIGYGHALKTGIAATDSDLVAILDADGTYPPEALPGMIAMAEHADMIVGDRGAAMNNVPWVRRPAKWLLKVLASLLAQRRINDVNSGLRVFRRAALEQFVPLLPDGYSFTTTITLCMLATNMTVIYQPIHYGRRIGHSKIRARHFFKFVFLVVRLTVLFQPLRVFLPLGALLFVAGAAKWIIDSSLSATVAFAMLSAILVWSVGLLADMITRLHLRPHAPRRIGGIWRR
jgi:glycosyltransferase involved in cell wall biosynthesis